MDLRRCLVQPRTVTCCNTVRKLNDGKPLQLWIVLQELPAASDGYLSVFDDKQRVVMSNHIHLVLRVRPDLARGWSFKYLTLLERTGRQLRAGERGTIPAQIGPILERLGVIGEGWVETMRQFGRRFKTVAGRRASLVALAVRRAKAWLQGQGAAALALR